MKLNFLFCFLTFRKGGFSLILCSSECPLLKKNETILEKKWKKWRKAKRMEEEGGGETDFEED